MAAKQRFAFYPKAEEGPMTPYVKRREGNPVLRGWPLVVAANLFSRSQWLSKALWNSNHFGDVKDIAGLDRYTYRWHPTVIPLAGESEPEGMNMDPALSVRQADDLAGRYHSAADYHELYKTGELTPLQVVEALLPLISRDGGPTAGTYAAAFICVEVDRILEEAAASTARYAAGKYISILDGVPIGIKDDIDVKGYISHQGMGYDPKAHFFKPAEATALPARRLIEAGGIVMGKQVMQELGTDSTGMNVRWGTPTNWFNNAYYPGGSSAGAGSSLGAGLVPIAIGTDSGLSVRGPPNFNGVYGLKPSSDRTCSMTSTTLVVGPMAATVSDLTIAYRLLAQKDLEDPVQSLFSTSRSSSLPAKKYIGVYKEWFEDADPEVVEACKEAIDYLVKEHQYEVVDITIPHIQAAQSAHALLCITEPAEVQRTRTPSPADWLSLVNHPNKIVLSVAAQTGAFELAKIAQLRELVMRHMAYLFKTYPGLLIVTPTVPVPGWKIHPGDQAYGFSDGDMSVKMMRYCWLASLTGCPAVTAPVAYVETGHGEGKMPVSLMATGEWGAEEQLLGWSGHLEQFLNDRYPAGRQKPRKWVDVIALAKKQGTETDAE